MTRFFFMLVLGFCSLFIASPDANVLSVSQASLATPTPSSCTEGKIAFGATYNRGKAQIYIINADGSGRRRFTYDRAYSAHPTWSPDGKQIAFATDRDSHYSDIYIINVDYSGQHRLTKTGNAHLNLEPTWSPDGKHIAFASSTTGPSNEFTMDIFLMSVDGSNIRRLTYGDAYTYHEYPSWSPDSKQIVLISDNVIAVMDADGSNLHNILNYFASSPAWSPDGKHIAFSAQSGLLGGDEQIHTMDADGSNVHRLTSEGFNTFPSWSPDGQCIVFSSSRDSYNLFKLYVMNADGSNQRRLTADLPYSEFEPVWSPN